MKNGEPLPDIIRREVGMGTPEDAAGIISFLASDAAAEITGQAFAVGGDRLALWSHPDLTAVEYHDGGWSADDLAAQWAGTFGDAVQSVGEEFPRGADGEMSRYEYGIDFDKIDAIDIHTHVEIDGCGHRSLDDELMAASEKYFKSGEERTPSIDAIADHYRSRNIAAVVFTVDAASASGHAANSVEEIAEGAARHNDVLIPFGSVDPGRARPPFGACTGSSTNTV